jgi:hypothetical protein
MTKTSAGMATLGPEAVHFKFSLYKLSEKAVRADVVDQLNMRLDHLTTMLTLITGEASESFNQHSAEIRDSYVCGCYTLANECRELAGLL